MRERCGSVAGWLRRWSVHWEIGTECHLVLLGVDDDTCVAWRRLRNRKSHNGTFTTGSRHEISAGLPCESAGQRHRIDGGVDAAVARPVHGVVRRMGVGVVDAAAVVRAVRLRAARSV